jgi:3-dehydroquinate dehydratase-1
MRSPEVCACITSSTDLDAALAARDLVSLYEVRMDLIGTDWPRVASALPHPWIACNRLASQGGACYSRESERIDSLKQAIGLGAGLVDVEMTAPDVGAFVRSINGSVRVLVSHHDFERTVSEDSLVEIVNRQRELGADICKVVSTARSAQDGVTMVRLVRRFCGAPIVAFAMGPLGMASRVLAPLAGAMFTYASLSIGREAAPGQLTVGDLRSMYDAIEAT